MDKDEFIKEVTELSQKVGASFKEIQIRTMKNKWGSCSHSGRVTFNSRILSESDERRKYIILHELLHLKYSKHDKLFASLLKAHMAEE
ncbi:M48 family metallopeptidase [Candidatus Parvarchaeota archaeon]|nr:M48 family metallopeptidase [Candidatus Parvarchaeota archaeon]MCL5976441.1 M48 family metallopeptidase [Candidatus Parvarchaeota archaeon]